MMRAAFSMMSRSIAPVSPPVAGAGRCECQTAGSSSARISGKSASLLTDRITPRIVDPEMEERLLAYYWQRRDDTPRADPGHGHRYRVVALHRALKVIGRIHYVALEKGKPAPLAFVPDVVATVRRMLVGLDLPGGLAAEFAALSWP